MHHRKGSRYISINKWEINYFKIKFIPFIIILDKPMSFVMNKSKSERVFNIKGISLYHQSSLEYIRLTIFSKYGLSILSKAYRVTCFYNTSLIIVRKRLWNFGSVPVWRCTWQYIMALHSLHMCQLCECANVKKSYYK